MQLDNNPPSAFSHQGHTKARRLRMSLLIAHLLLLFICIPPGFLAASGTSLARPIPGIALAPKARGAEAQPAPTGPGLPARSIVFLHGMEGPDFGVASENGASNGGDCTKYWGDARSFLGKVLPGEDFRTVSYYKGDVGCGHDNGNEQKYSADLHAKAYADHCLHYMSGGEGTNNESIYHLSCLFAWYLYYNFGQKGSSEIIIAHSMGGLILREAIFQVQKQTGAFPRTLGHITQAITLNTPHMGLLSAANWDCGGCQQLKDMSHDSPLIKELLAGAQDPQAGGTNWTLIGSYCDIVNNAVNMTGANHALIYDKWTGDPTRDLLPAPHDTCYDHGGALHDTNAAAVGSVYYCDTQDVVRRNCLNAATTWHRSDVGHPALDVIYLVILGVDSPVDGTLGPTVTCTPGPHKRCT